MKEQQYLRLLCSHEHYDEMLEAIQETDFPIRSGYPYPIYGKNSQIIFWVFELDVIYDCKNANQRFLIEKQEKYC